MIVVPCGITVSLSEGDRAQLLAYCKEFVSQLMTAGLRCRGDFRDNYSPGWKFNHWELKVRGEGGGEEGGEREGGRGRGIERRREGGR